MNKPLKIIIYVGLFLIPFIPLFVSPALFFPFITSKAFTWRIIVEIVFAAWIILAITNVDYRPKRSLILYSLFIFLAVIGVSNILGVAPMNSLWSNFERMEGYWALLHLGMFFLVIGSVFREIDWKRWWNVSIFVSLLMVIYGVLQISGLKTINQGGVRVDGTFGNATYLAVYMLIHIFITGMLLARGYKSTVLRWVYGLVIVSQLFILYHTATRGAILGLLGGLLIIAILNIRNKEDAFMRKMGLSIITILVIVSGGFLALKNTSFVQDSPVLSRFSTITTEELKSGGRSFVWPIALEGIKERPILGWGQENFMRVFQAHYVPEMYRLEPWFDRAHNIFLDWGIAGGLLGLLSYLALYFTLLYLMWFRDNDLPYIEKSVLTGLIAAYSFHNVFVFDNLVSYILFFSILAYIHFRNSDKPIWSGTLPEGIKLSAPILVVILLLSSIYFVNIKPIKTNFFLIEALKATQTPGAMSDAPKYFKEAYNTPGELGKTEVIEQATSNARTILSSDISLGEKESFFRFVREATISRAEKYPGSARQQLSTGAFLSTTGQLNEALTYLNRARELMPGKQDIYMEIASVQVNQNNREGAIETLLYLGSISPPHRDLVNEYVGKIRAGEI